MPNLIENPEAIAFQASNMDGGCLLSMYSIDMNSRKSTEIFSSHEAGFFDHYRKLAKFRSKSPSTGSRTPNIEQLLFHIQIYKSNLYGFYLYGKEHEDDRVQFFKEGYISCFGLEIGGIFRDLPYDQTMLFDRDLSAIPAMSPDNYSEWLSLKQFYEFWQLQKVP